MIIPSRVKLGKKAARRDPRTLMLASYLPQSLPAPPESVDWTGKIGQLGMMMNDSLGDCTCAGAGHMIQSWTGNATGNPNILPDSEILKAYEDVGGYRPGSQNTDNGAVEIDVLNYWRQTGIGGNKITAYAALQPQSKIELMDAVWIFGGAYLGVALPMSAQGQNVWSVPPGGPRIGTDGEPGGWGGHCVPAVAYSPRGIAVITWGRVLWMTWEFAAVYLDESYAIISNDWVGASALTPSNFNMDQLQTDLGIVTKI